MSTFRNPVGPQPSNIYWRRRIIVGLALLAVIVIVLLIVFQPRGGTPTTPNATKTNTQTPASSNPEAACASGAVEITAATDKSLYAAGESPQITLTVTNMGSVPCTINAGTTQQDYRITSGTELYWNSKDCQTDATDAPVVLEPNVPKSTAPIVWDRTRSSTTTCATERSQVPAGGASYHLNITLGDLKSNDVQFALQ